MSQVWRSCVHGREDCGSWQRKILFHVALTSSTQFSLSLSVSYRAGTSVASTVPSATRSWTPPLSVTRMDRSTARVSSIFYSPSPEPSPESHSMLLMAYFPYET